MGPMDLSRFFSCTSVVEEERPSMDTVRGRLSGRRAAPCLLAAPRPLPIWSAPARPRPCTTTCGRTQGAAPSQPALPPSATPRRASNELEPRVTPPAPPPPPLSTRASKRNVTGPKRAALYRTEPTPAHRRVGGGVHLFPR